MAAKRPRFIVTGNMRFNDVSAKGQKVMYVGPCTSFGSRNSKSRKIPKNQLDHKLFKFMDKAWLRKYKLTQFESFTVSNVMFDRMLTNKDDLTDDEIAKMLIEAIPEDPKKKRAKSKASKPKTTKKKRARR